MTLSPRLPDIKSRWAVLARGAGFLGLVIGGFIKPPDVYDPASSFSTAKAFAIFIIAIFIGLSFYLSRKLSRRKDAGKWAISTVIFLALCIASYLVSEYLKDKYTCKYANRAVIIGTEYTEHGKDYLSSNPGISCIDLLMDHEGKAYEVWKPETINTSRILLIAAYITSFQVAALCILSVTQLIACFSVRKSSKRKTSNSK
ncbi:MAG: hypothetical protein M3362_27195 [Acidobacteriota bacterium]|nr:hypothetical protein [Acidobacteriota bacterium]